MHIVMMGSRRKLMLIAWVVIGFCGGCAKVVVVHVPKNVVWKRDRGESGGFICNKVVASEGNSKGEYGSAREVKMIDRLNKNGGGRANGLAWLMAIATNINSEIMTKEGGESAESPGGMIINGVMGIGKSINKMGKRLKYGFGKMWANDKLARAVRKRINNNNKKKSGAGAASTTTVAEPMTYGELMVIRSAREDGQKVLLMAVILTLMPELLWVALRFIPGIVPSAFTFPEERLAHQNQYDRLRLRATLQLQQSLDEMVSSRDKHKAAESKTWGSVIRHVLESPSSSSAFEVLRPIVYAKDEGQTQRGRMAPHTTQTINTLPQPVVKAFSEAFGLTLPLVPAFIQRRSIRKYIDRIDEGDRVLISGGALTSLSECELREACCERAIGTQGCKKEAMQKSLERWIEIITPPNILPEGMVWVPERAKLIALGLSTVSSVRQSKEAKSCRELLVGGI